MTLQNKIEELKNTHNVVNVINLDEWYDQPVYHRKLWLDKQISLAHKETYENNERIIFTLTKGDTYDTIESSAGLILTDLQTKLNSIDISNFFVILLTNDNRFIPSACEWLRNNVSKDPVPFTHISYANEINTKTLTPKFKSDYNSITPIKIKLENLSEKNQYLLTESKTFCMYPWIHLHTYPTGAAYPCCHSEMPDTIGDCHTDTLETIWNNTPLKTIRTKMLTDVPVSACTRCYEQEAAGFFSGRLSANKHHGHHIARVDETKEDGTLERFEMTYWDIRFSNLCNLSCRSCGHIFSSSWYQDQVKLAGPVWAANNKTLNIAGRNKNDMWEQLIPHLDYVEQIYFAGGEPLMMEEHYNILDELERRGRFDVRLVYNTNFTQTKLKDREVFDYWRKFDSVAVGASLDAMGPRAEYIRKGTEWDIVERNRATMMEVCPKVDFYVSPTLSIMNALHLPDFHRAWVEKGYIKPQDLNVNILQDPAYLRIDIAPLEYKKKIKSKYEEHLAWLRPLDPLNRATVGFESAINYMMSTDNTQLLSKFWSKTEQLDVIRKENILDVIPELKDLK